MSALLKWGSMSVYALGVLFCLFSCLSVRRMLIVAVLGILAFAGFSCKPVRRLAAVAGTLVKRFPAVTFAALSAAAVAMRVLFFLRIQEVGLRRVQRGDANNFWKYAQEVASGAFPDVKSWTTVFSQAASIKLFGDSVVPVFCLNSCLQICTAAALFAFAKRNLSSGAAMFSAAVCLLSPSIIRLNCSTMSETPYYLFLALSLLALSEWVNSRRIAALAAMPFAIWLAIWTRGEAVLLLLIVPACLFLDALRAEAGSRLKAVGALVALCIALCGLAAVGYAINARFHGTNTPLCSNDSWWPRLYGSNVASRGRVSGPKTSPKGVTLVNDKTIIFERYRRDHADDPGGGVLERRPMHCPKELIPYIKAEISRRWTALSFMEKAKFVVIKEWLPWNNPYTGRGEVADSRMRRILLADVPTTLALLLCLTGLIGRMIMVASGRTRGDSLVQCVPLLYLFGIVCTIAIAESSIRHGVVALLICPLYVFPYSCGDRPLKLTA